MRYAFVLLAFCIASLLRAQPKASTKPASTAVADILQSVELSDTSFVLGVWTCGCTTKRDFIFQIDSSDRAVPSILVRRDHPDTCGMSPSLVRLEFFFEEIGYVPRTPIRIKNLIFPSDLITIIRKK